jgi:hypothetical protein
MYTAEQLIEKLDRARDKALYEFRQQLAMEAVPVLEKPPVEVPDTNSGDSGYDRRMNLSVKAGDDGSLEKYGNKLADDPDLQR